MAKSFVVGEHIENDIGWYTVFQLVSKSRMLVKYDNGGVFRALDIEEQLQYRATKAKKQATRASVVLFKQLDADYFKFIGFLASNCAIDAHIKTEERVDFAQDYKIATGIDLDVSQKINGLTVGAVKQWGYSLRIYFDSWVFNNISALSFQQAATKISKSGSAINNQRWCFELFRMGFRIARGHDIPTIKANVPQQFHADFDAGLVMIQPVAAVAPVPQLVQ